MVDEAQDFAPIWFKCILAALVDCDNNDLLIVGDNNQKVFFEKNPSEKKPPSWKSLGINVSGGRAKKLEINYRNTKKILELAALFSNHGNSNQDDDAGAYIIPVDVSSSKREGDFRPIFIECQNRKEEVNTVISQIKDLLQNQTWQGCNIPKIEARNIGILYRHSAARDKPFINELLTQLNHFTKAVWLNESSDSRRRVNEPGVKIQTIHSAKGLQYAAVFVLWADLFPAPFSDTDEEQERNLFYVALTRPEEYLMITSSGHSSFTNILCDYAGESTSVGSERGFEDFDDDIPF
jgi:superfamily I DNA/RNA helicase